MIEAWCSRSLTITSASSKIAATVPAFAAKPDWNISAASACLKSANARSISRCELIVPAIVRTAPVPAPSSEAARDAAAFIRGWFARPRELFDGRVITSRPSNTARPPVGPPDHRIHATASRYAEAVQDEAIELDGFLADSVVGVQGKLYVLGAGWNQISAALFPARHDRVGIGLLVRLPAGAERRGRRFELRVVGPDGEALILGTGSDGPVSSITGEFTAGGPDEQGVPLAL